MAYHLLLSIMNIKHLIAEKTLTPSLGVYVVSPKYTMEFWYM